MTDCIARSDTFTKREVALLGEYIKEGYSLDNAIILLRGNPAAAAPAQGALIPPAIFETLETIEVHMDAMSALKGWRMQAIRAALTHARLSLPSTISKSRVMQAADKAAQVVGGWSDSKRDYAERATASSLPSTERGGK